jgi:hypothetical protein
MAYTYRVRQVAGERGKPCRAPPRDPVTLHAGAIVTKDERKSFTNAIVSIQSLLDDILDQIEVTPKPKAKAKASKKRGK